MIASYACDRDRRPGALHFTLELGATEGEQVETLDLCVSCVGQALLTFVQALPPPDKAAWLATMRQTVAPHPQEVTRG